MFELDFNERNSADVPLSYEDRQFVNKMKAGVHQLEDRHYELPLPLKNDNVKLPNNKALAEYRLTKLMRGFNLHKCLSNSREILETTFHERVNAVKNLDLSKETLPMERTGN